GIRDRNVTGVQTCALPIFSIVSTLWLGLLVNWMSAALGAGAILLYVVFYTILLKRRTSPNIVWGGVAGCMPVLIGWSAVTGTVRSEERRVGKECSSRWASA